jgi:hypothetical protein
VNELELLSTPDEAIDFALGFERSLRYGLAHEADAIRRQLVQEGLGDKRTYGVFATCPTAAQDQG